MNSSVRVKWIDISKGLLMIFIVLGHVLHDGVIRDILYAFHVPCFFFLAGVTEKNNDLAKKIGKNFRRLMIPYYIFGLISIVIYACIGRIAASELGTGFTGNIFGNIVGLLYGSSRCSLQYNRPLWFLPALFAAKVLYVVLFKLTKGNKVLLGILSCLCCGISFWYTSKELFYLPFSFELTLKLYPFYLLGNFSSSLLASIEQSMNKFHKWIVALPLFTVTCLFAYVSPAVNYTNNAFPDPFLFMCVAVVGCLANFGIAIAIGKNELLEYIGKNTMIILVLHKFPVVFFQIIEPFKTWLTTPDSLKGFLLSAVPITAISILLTLFCGYVIRMSVDKISNKILPKM